MNRYFAKRRAKKAQQVAKVEVNFSAALPTVDDFRTSLIMSSLSKRFSMLREQDDPNTLVGKASDDSVLAPPRQSRLMEFGYTPARNLQDIAEVSSIHADFRPPFANERSDSYASESGYDTDDGSHTGSIMSRARPGEGNILFGGRQKIYKIPLAGAASLSSLAGSSGMRGRALYDDDVSVSTFQRWRQEERNRMARNSSDADELQSPAQASPPHRTARVQRQTSTSTSNTTERASTAATSIASQSSMQLTANSSVPSLASPPQSNNPAVERSVVKNRLSSLHQPARGRISPPATQAPSRSDTPDSLASASGPPPRLYPHVHLSKPKDPFSFLDQYKNSPLMAAIDPNDRGKATAMGAFNKPQAFSEQEYLERQLAMRNVQESRLPSRGKVDDKNSIIEAKSEDRSSYAPSNSSVLSSSASLQSPVQHGISIFQNAASQMRLSAAVNQANVPAIAESSVPSMPEEPVPEEPIGRNSDAAYYEAPHVPPVAPAHLSKYETLASKIQKNGPPLQPPVDQHPAFKSMAKLQSSMEKQPTTTSPVSDPLNEFDFTEAGGNEEPPSIPALAVESSGLGLSRLIQAHLRQGSDASSCYAYSRNSAIDYAPSVDNRQQEDTADSLHSHVSNPFALEDGNKAGQSGNTRFSAESESEEMGKSTGNSPKDVKASRRRGMSQLPENADAMPWSFHSRGPSAETIQEEDALSNEIAKRTRMIQDRLEATRKQHESTLDDRPRSSTAGPFRGFDILRSKSSKESMKRNNDPNIASKAARSLLGTPAEKSSTDRYNNKYEEYGSTSRSQSTSRRANSRSNSRPGTRGTAKSPNLENLPSVSDSPRTSVESMGVRQNSNPTHPLSMRNSNSSGTDIRSRSNSNQSGARSGNGRHRDEVDRPEFYEPESIPEDAVSSHLDRGRATAYTHQDHSGSRLQIQVARNAQGLYEKGLAPSPQGLHSPLSPSSVTSSPRLPFHSGVSGGISPSLSSRGPSPAFPISPVVGVPVNRATAYLNTPPTSGNSTPIASYFPGGTNATNGGGMNRPRSQSRRRILKAEISEPRLIATTSAVEAIPPQVGSSRPANPEGKRVSPSALPSLNPLRRKFTLGRGSAESHRQTAPAEDALAFKSQPYESSIQLGRTSAQPHLGPVPDAGFRPRHRLRKSSSEGERLGMRIRMNQHATASNLSLTTRPAVGTIEEGGMF